MDEQRKHDQMIKDTLKTKKDRLVENTFVFSLKALRMDTNKEIMKMIMPSIQDQQATKLPTGASLSKSYNLLRNTFSIEVYEQFEKHKKQKRESRAITKQLESKKNAAFEKLHEIT